MMLTFHAEKRKHTRGIANEAIELALAEGRPLAHNPDRILLTREMMWDAVKRNVLTAEKARRIERSVPLVVVAPGERVVTVLRPTHRISGAKRGRRRTGRVAHLMYS